MARTPDPIGVGLDLTDIGSDPTNVGEIRHNAGDIKAKDQYGVFNLRTTGGLPTPNEAGEILYAVTASIYQQVRPLVSCEGWLLNDDGLLLAVG